jgi:hypothetical protein
LQLQIQLAPLRVESLEGLDDDAFLALDDWASFYRKDYVFVGKLAGGHYYDVSGGAVQVESS